MKAQSKVDAYAYPFNVVCDIFSDGSMLCIEFMNKYNGSYLDSIDALTKNLEGVLATLATNKDPERDKRNKEMFICRYKRHLSYSAVGTLFNVSGCQAREVIAHIRRLLAHPAKCSYLLEGEEGYLAYQKQRAEEAEQSTLQESTPETLTKDDVRSIEIIFADEARIRHALRRRNASYDTIDDVYYAGYSKIRQVRCIGDIAMDRIVQELKRFDFNIKEFLEN